MQIRFVAWVKGSPVKKPHRLKVDDDWLGGVDSEISDGRPFNRFH